MRLLLFPFMLLAGVGLCISIVAHIASLTGVDAPQSSPIWGLHIGIFVVWLPTVLVGMRMTRQTNQRDFWKVALSGCPSWMSRGFYILFAYAMLNFIIFIFGKNAPRLAALGPTSNLRGFSGHWMVFYAAAFGVLYSAIRKPSLLTRLKCSAGHPVGPMDRFCAQCGDDLSNTAVPQADV